MEFFQKAKVVRLRSHHDKYLLADEDKENVYQDRNGYYKNAKWIVEIVEGADLIRLVSCYGKYLTASNMPFLFGGSGKKVLQTLPTRLNSSLVWEPIREGVQVRLKTCYGQYLRANGGLPPWRNSVTHDIPKRTKTANWILWDVDLVALRPQPQNPTQTPTPPSIAHDPSFNSTSSTCSSPSSTHSDDVPFVKFDLMSYESSECEDLEEHESPKKEGRIIFYNVGDENGDVANLNEEKFFTFKGSRVDELKKRLNEETKCDDILVCCRNPFNAKLYPISLQLPPNNADMHVIVVPSTFKALLIYLFSAWPRELVSCFATAALSA
ncbi:hypothetical protein RJT34_18226 [Clitoria ternatea]|uniref:DUF569 domain-containing protein n=1 Tax=Clitoria ternatea TaxID=43366 RepID=A0AAN9JAE0_CLITE